MATLTFDPTSEDATNTPLDVWNTGAYAVEAMAFPAPPLETVTIGSIDTEGDRIAARGHRNRQISLTINVTASTATAFRTALGTLEEKVAKLAASGGTLKWVNDDAAVYVLDILAADGYDVPYDITYFTGSSASVQVTLPALPYARGTETSYTAVSETTQAEVTLTVTGPAGDVPALGRLVLTDINSQPRYDTLWGMEAEPGADVTTSLLQQAEAWSLGTGVASTADAGAVNGTSAQVTLSSGRDVVAKQVDIGGAFAVWARCRADQPADVTLIWNNDTTFTDTKAVNPTVRIGGNEWLLVNLGIVTSRVNTHGATPLLLDIYAAPVSTAPLFRIDQILLVPIDGGYGRTSSATFGGTTSGSTRQFEIASSGATRRPTAAAVWVEHPTYEGDYLYVPPGTTAGRQVRIVVRPTSVSGVVSWTSTADTIVDNGIYDTQVQLFVTPRFLSIR